MDIEKAAAYFGISINKLHELTDDKTCGYVLWAGSKKLIKRQKMDEYLDHIYSI